MSRPPANCLAIADRPITNKSRTVRNFSAGSPASSAPSPGYARSIRALVADAVRPVRAWTDVGPGCLPETPASHKLLGKPSRRRHTTNSNHRYHKWKNVVKGCVPDAANRLWVSGITYIDTDGGCCCLHLVTDCYSHSIVSWSLFLPAQRLLHAESPQGGRRTNGQGQSRRAGPPFGQGHTILLRPVCGRVPETPHRHQHDGGLPSHRQCRGGTGERNHQDRAGLCPATVFQGPAGRRTSDCGVYSTFTTTVGRI